MPKSEFNADLLVDLTRVKVGGPEDGKIQVVLTDVDVVIAMQEARSRGAGTYDVWRVEQEVWRGHVMVADNGDWAAGHRGEMRLMDECGVTVFTVA